MLLKRSFILVVSVSAIFLGIIGIAGIGPFKSDAKADGGLNVSVQGPSTIAEGQSASFSFAAVNSSGQVSNSIVDFEVMNSSNQKVFQQFFAGQTFNTNQSSNFSVSWTPTSTGQYTVKSGVFTANWANLLSWNNNAMSVSVTPPPAPKFSATGSASPATTFTGQADKLSASVQDSGSGSASNIVVMLEVANSAGTNVFQQLFNGQNFTPGETENYSVAWTPASTGDYTLNVGIFAADWSSMLGWVGNIGKVTANATVHAANLSAANGTKLYVDPNSLAAQAVSSNSSEAAALNVIASQPTGEWFGDWDTNIYQDVKNVVDAASSEGATPVLVAYNIPDRDCGGYSSGGATSASAYTAWMQSFASAIGSRKAIVILEPDALANMDCLSSADQATRLSLLSSAVTTLKSLGSTSVYIDAGNPNWIAPATMAQRLQGANISNADGFAVNTSNFYSTASDEQYGDALSALVGNKHYVVDTGRNGNGPDANDDWCNPSGRAIGALPGSNTSNALVDSFLWIKPPGESDGTCNGGPSAGTFWPQYAVDLVQSAGL